MTEAGPDAVAALSCAVPAVPRRTVFFASDPAGARACLSLGTLLRARDAQALPHVFSNRVHAFAGEFPVAVVGLQQAAAEQLDGAALIFCGTSHPDSSKRFELGAIAAASRLGVRSAAFVDHWTNFRLRFERADGRLELPDEIWVMDEHAVTLAAADGLPRDRLRVSGSPTLAFLAQLWRAPRTRDDVRIAAGLPRGPAILYAPDPISLRLQHGRGGFDELRGATDLAQAIAAAIPGAAVMARFHPLEPEEKRSSILRAFIDGGVPRVVVAPALSGPELCLVADVVVGFYSNFLLEARALGRPVIRYLPEALLDPLGHLEFGRRVREPGVLAEALAACVLPGRLTAS
jgi:hypothetical protein